MKKSFLLIFCIFTTLFFTNGSTILAQSPQVTLFGKVTDADTGEPLIGVSIIVAGTKTGTVSDVDGTYSLLWHQDEKVTLECAYIGYETQKQTVETLYKREVEVNFKLSSAGVELEEVVVTGRSVREKSKSSGLSMAKVSPKKSKSKRKKGMFGKTSATMDMAMPAEAPAFSTAPITYADDVAIPESNIAAGTLTAGEIHDFSKWELWQDIATEDLNEWSNHWNFHLTDRYTVQVLNNQGFPIINASVYLEKNNNTIWTAKTDNTGKAELWNNVFNNGKKAASPDEIKVKYNGKTHEIKQLIPFNQGVNFLKIEEDCKENDVLDIAFVVDATGSMGDEISYLQTELKDVIERIQAQRTDLTINLGSVFYKDETDDYVTRKEPFTEDITKAVQFMQKQKAGGGGDYPEAMDAALDVAINELKWSNKTVAKLLFLVLDAPPHFTPDILKKLEKLTHLAAEKGVRIIPVAGSGIDKSTEYLMRSFALTTNGTYVFLTDHSGVGNPHIEPTTDEYEVEKFNDLLIRVIGQYTEVMDCDKPIASIDDPTDGVKNPKEDPKNSVVCYPNPTTGIFRVKLEKAVKELFITDITGKILLRFDDLTKGETEINLANFPNGTYFVRFVEKEKLRTGRVVLAY